MSAPDLTGLSRSARRRPLWVPGEEHELSIGRAGVEKLLRHRDPFLFVDQITGLDLQGECIRGQRYVDPAEAVLAGHFPGEPIYPGVLQVEMAGQLSICLLHFLLQGSTALPEEPRDVRGLKVHTAEFLSPVLPGSHLTLLSRALEWDELTGVFVGQVWCGPTICSWGVWEAYLVDPSGGFV